MGRTPTHHRQARTRVKIAQGALAALAIPAIVLATGLGVPSDAPAPVAELVIPDAPAEDAALPPPAPPAIDAAGVSARLSQIANRPTPKPPEQNPVDPEANPVQPVAGRVIKFLGRAGSGARPVGLFSIDGKQRFLRTGEESADLKLVRVERDHAVVRVNGAEQRLALADRTAPAAGIAAPSPAMAPPNMGSNMTGGMGEVSPEQGMEESEKRRAEMLERIRRRQGRAEENGEPRP